MITHAAKPLAISPKEAIFDIYKLVTNLVHVQFKELKRIARDFTEENPNATVNLELARRISPKEEAFLNAVLEHFQETFNQIANDQSISLKIAPQSRDLSEAIANSLLTKTQDNLGRFNMRLETVLGECIPLHNNPLHPFMCCKAFSDAIERLDIGQSEHFAVLHFFLETLEENYESMLGDADSLLIIKGVLPDISNGELSHRYESEIKRQQTQDKRKDTLLTLFTNAKLSDTTITPENFDTALSDLMSQSSQLFDAGANIGVGTPMEQISDDKLNKRLALLNNIPDLNQTDSYPSFDENALRSESASFITKVCSLVGSNAEKIHHKTANRIKLLSLMFDQFEQDKNLTPEMKFLLGLMQGPIARMAIIDTEFFINSENAGQQLLDALAQAGATWHPSANRKKDSLYNKMAEIITKTNEQFDGSYSVFEKCLADFTLFSKAENRRAKLIEQRIVDAEQAKARTEQARLVAARHCARLLKLGHERHELPEGLVTFFGTAWNQVLFYIHNINDSTDNNQWKEAVELEQQLLSLLDSSDSGKVNKLLEKLSQQLKLVGMQKHEVEKWIATLAQAFLKIDNTQTTTSQPLNPEVEQAMESSESHDNQTSPYAMDDKLPNMVSADKFEAMADSLSANTWVTYRVNFEPTKVRTAAIINHTNRVILVNRNGTKSAILSRKEIADKLRNGDMRLVETSMYFDRGFASAIAQLSR